MKDENHKENISDVLKLISMGVKYKDHDKYKMTRLDRCLYWFSTIFIYGSLVVLLFLILFALI